MGNYISRWLGKMSILLILLLPIYANAAGHQAYPVMLQNNAAQLTQAIDRLSNKQDASAYDLSMPLMASAQLNNKSQYLKILSRLKILLLKDSLNKTKKSFNAWLWGRVLFAASTIGDTKTVILARKMLKELLKATPADEFSTWAIGYLANVSSQSFKANQFQLKQNTNRLIEQYQRAKYNSSIDKADLHTKLSNALWALVLDTQAAANAHQSRDYQQFLKQLRETNQNSSVPAALTKGLLSTPTANDYPAWALGILQVAAIKMQDHNLYEALVKPLQKANKTANNTGAIAEFLLGETNAVIANTFAAR